MNMPLPILPTSQATPDTLVRLFHNTERLWIQHFSEETQLAVGNAFCNSKLQNVFEANQLLEASLPVDLSPADAVRQVQEHFQEQGTHCWSWTMNPSSSPDRVSPLIEHLRTLGLKSRFWTVMHLSRMPQTRIQEVGGLTIIPARASFKHTQMLYEESASQWNEPQLAERSMSHLDDPHWDALIALKDGQAVATAGVLAAGEIGRIDEVFVTRPHRRQGIGRTIMGRVLEICARAQFKHILLSCDPANTPALALYERLGFSRVRDVESYVDPEAAKKLQARP